ncbi:hypothetical protein PPERSA_01332 [Pseudocohnilembus persalinus]|uniref:Progesterone-induced-blocking factor 1 n=1 Tax=Pseudocohnilembus persalinus TaxID=266149 RepID=A0A0V0QH98_PSEPJ|nr:hypothetical protein PPERSA_01332 [Pseudocohnilembus persalinus]|eukprot:KRX01429.1 hypothetical protein PPERSA_01332 [Pseudocohnilembus persalinus]
MYSNSRDAQLMKGVNFDPNVFTEDELKMLEKGGITVTDSEGEDSMIQHQRQNPYSKSRQFATQRVNQEENVLEQEINRIKTTFENDKRMQLQEHRRETEQYQNEIRQLRARHVHVEGQVPLIKEALAQVKDMLSGLVPENVYLKLRDLPEKDLPPSEWILVNVWELVYPFKKDAELQKKELFRLREELKQTVDKQHHILSELEHANRLLYNKDDDYKRHQLNYENARKALEVELSKANEEIDILREKGNNYDELNRRFKQMEQEKFLLEEKMGFYDSEAGKEGKHVLSEVYKTTDDMRRKTELLNQDKEYLTKENIELLEKNKRLEDRLDRMESELIESKNQAQEYLYKLLNHKTETMVDYEKRVNKEMNELRDKFDRELRESKSNMAENYELKIRILTDSKEELEMKLENAEGLVREKDKSYNNLLVENRTLQKQVNSDLAEMRINYRIKSEELERITNIYQECNDNLKQTKYENDMLRDKLNILKAEYYKAEGQGKQDQANIRAENAVLKERLREYDQMEKEIDEAVEGMASQQEDIKDSDNPYLLTINNAPTSTKRRVKQAMNLAQKLMLKQKECEHYQKELRSVQQELEVREERLKISEDLLTKTNQPYSMLLSQIEEKEKEMLKFRQVLKQERSDYDNLKEEYNTLKKTYDKLNEDCKKLLIRRQNIQNIQTLLIKLSQSDASEVKGNVKSLINEITEILQNKSAVGGQPAFLGGTLRKIDGSQYNQYNVPEREENKMMDSGYNEQPSWANKLRSRKK